MPDLEEAVAARLAEFSTTSPPQLVLVFDNGMPAGDAYVLAPGSLIEGESQHEPISSVLVHASQAITAGRQVQPTEGFYGVGLLLWTMAAGDPDITQPRWQPVRLAAVVSRREEHGDLIAILDEHGDPVPAREPHLDPEVSHSLHAVLYAIMSSAN